MLKSEYQTIIQQDITTLELSDDDDQEEEKATTDKKVRIRGAVGREERKTNSPHSTLLHTIGRSSERAINRRYYAPSYTVKNIQRSKKPLEFDKSALNHDLPAFDAP